MREQRLARGRPGRAVTAACDGEPLVRGDVLHEAEQLGRERRLRQRHGAARARRAPAPRRRRRRRARRASPSLRTSTTCTSPSPRDERGDEAGRRLAVERAAALLEQRRLLVQRRVAVQLEQLALDLRDDLPRAASPSELLGEHLVVARRSSAGSSDGIDAELVEQLPRQARPARRARRRARPAAPAGRPRRRARTAPDPGQVVEADLVDDDPLRLDAEQPRERALEADRDVAEADGAVAGVEQRARDDPDRVREVDDPGVRRGAARARARRSRARPAPCAAPSRSRRRRSSPGRCSRRRAARSRPRGAPPGRRRGSGPARSRRRRRARSRSPVTLELAGVALPLEHPRGEAADDLAPLASMSCRTSSRTSIRSRSRESPETSSGVYVEPPPMTATFIPSPPSA